MVAGAVSSAIGLVQVFAPGLAGRQLDRALRTSTGRAVGNLRQPNHLSSLLLWAIVAVVWLGEARVLRRWAATLLALLFIFVVVLTASRTGALEHAAAGAVGRCSTGACRASARWLLGLRR